MIKVFISSPYTIGDVAVNVKRSMDAANELMDAGFAPYCPLLSHFLHIHHPRSYQDWTLYDNEWLIACDAILRLPGESVGADAEVKFAASRGIPAFGSIQELVNCYKSVMGE